MYIDNLANQKVFIEFLGPINFYLGLGLKVVSAIFLGIIVGIDRDKKFKSAGIKTQVMICVGSCIYTSIGLLNMYMYRIGDNVDPNRLTAQIVSGIGFLGAGAIMQSRGTVIGLTTAATVWVVAALGICVGTGYIFSALFFTITILFILNIIEPLIKIIYKEQTFLLEIVGNKRLVAGLERVLLNYELEPIDQEVFASNEGTKRCSLHITIKASNRDMKRIISHLRDDVDVDTFTHKALRKN